MSGVAIARYLLANNAGVLSAVQATSITSGDSPMNTPLPAIAVKEVSATQRKIVAMNASKYLITERVQINVQAKSYAQKKAVLGLIRSALPLSGGTVNGFACDSILPDIEGPDVDDADALIYFQSVDFFVRFTR